MPSAKPAGSPLSFGRQDCWSEDQGLCCQEQTSENNCQNHKNNSGSLSSLHFFFQSKNSLKRKFWSEVPIFFCSVILPHVPLSYRLLYDEKKQKMGGKSSGSKHRRQKVCGSKVVANLQKLEGVKGVALWHSFLVLNIPGVLFLKWAILVSIHAHEQKPQIWLI